MAPSRYETGSYTNRGFAGVDTNGICEKLTNWLGRPYSTGGAGWTLIDDQHTVLSGTYTVPDHTNDRCYRVGHGLITGQEVYVTTATTLPVPLSAASVYRVIYVDADNFKLADTLVLALAGTNINITTAGTGVQTVTSIPYKVYCNIAAPVVNDVANFIKVAYGAVSSSNYSSHFRITCCLWWDTVNHIPIGIWAQYSLGCDIAATNNYWFSGNTDFVNVVSQKITTEYHQFCFGKWVGNPLLVEATNKTGILISGVTAGASVTLPIGTGQAANFTIGNYYFIYDMNGHSWVDYVKITARDLGLDTITVQNIGQNFPTGSVLGAYPHRFYAFSQGRVTAGDTGNLDNTNYDYSTIPYVSSTSGILSNIFHAQTGNIRIGSAMNFYTTVLTGGDPEDEGYYYVQKPTIAEYHRGDGITETTGVRLFGSPETANLYISSNSNITYALTTRTIGGKKYMGFNPTSTQCTTGGDAGTTVLIPAEDL